MDALDKLIEEKSKPIEKHLDPKLVEALEKVFTHNDALPDKSENRVTVDMLIETLKEDGMVINHTSLYKICKNHFGRKSYVKK